MSWKKHFQTVPQGDKLQASLNRQARLEDSTGGGMGSKFSSYLPEVYAGNPNRRERYMQYQSMDQDSEINRSLDTIAEFCTQQQENEETLFDITYNKEATSTQVDLLGDFLKQWTRVNNFRNRIWRIFRNALMYGDQFFIRDPQTAKWLWVDPSKVEKIIVDESKGKEPDQYVIRELDLNLQGLVATNNMISDKYTNLPTAWAGSAVGSSSAAGHNNQLAPYTSPQSKQSRFDSAQNSWPVDAQYIVHLSLSEGLDANWPFGNSILEPVFKTYKQKELLEDAIIIYRVQRAPERRVFYIDTGDMPGHRSMAHVERIKNEIHQRRIPNRTGGGSSILDASYNPLSIIEDYFFAQCMDLNTKIPLLDGRTLTLQNIINEYNEGKDNYVYGLSNNSFELEDGKIEWAGITRKNAQVMEIELDNNKTVTVTPDHKFVLRDGSEVEAKNLRINDSLMPLELFDGCSGPKQNKKKYKKYRCNNTGKKKFVHTTIANKPVGKDTQVHHKDLDSFNNNPSNLEVMLTEEHIELHRKIGSYSLQTRWNDKNGRINLIKGMRALYDNRTEEFDKMLSDRNRKNAKEGWKNKTYEERLEVTKKSVKALNKYVESRNVKYSIEMFDAMKELFNSGITSKEKLIKELRYYKPYIDAYKRANPTTNRLKCHSEAPSSYIALNKIVNVLGYESYGDWKSDYTGLPKYSSKPIKKKNHKIIRISLHEEKVDTGDITILSKSNSHWFGLDAGIYVHNSSSGRGSRVETLPGGDGLADIDDLKYFNNKLVRGLSVPSSYLPTEREDGSATYNDGRVGTAYIQEYRFAKYCQRLQSLLEPEFDREFKLFLRQKGIEIDSSLFEIRFQEPQNFSKFRQIELDSAQIGVFSSLAGTDYIAKRVLLRKYLGWSEDEILENEELWQEENKNKFDGNPGGGPSGSFEGGGLAAVGVEPPLEGDFEGEGDFEEGDIEGGEEGAQSPISGDEGIPSGVPSPESPGEP